MIATYPKWSYIVDSLAQNVSQFHYIARPNVLKHPHQGKSGLYNYNSPSQEK